MQRKRELINVWRIGSAGRRARLVIAPALHGALDAKKIGHLLGPWVEPGYGAGFRDLPPPALGVAIGKGKAAALVVAVGRHVKPHRTPVRRARGIPELGIEQGVRVLVNEDKELAGNRAPDFGEFLPEGDIRDAGDTQVDQGTRGNR